MSETRRLVTLGLAGVALLGGCSLMGDKDSSRPAAPPMLGAADAERQDPFVRRQKIRFASEVSNARKRHLAVRQSEPSSPPPLSPQTPPHPTVAHQTPPQLAAAPVGMANRPAAILEDSFPQPTPRFAAAPAPFPLMQRLPDVRRLDDDAAFTH